MSTAQRDGSRQSAKRGLMIMRRRVLRSGVAIGVTGWLGRRAWLRSPARAGQQPRSARFARLLTHVEGARVIGHAYLRLVPGETDPAALVAVVAAGLPDGPRALDSVTDARLRRLLLDGIREDFAHERTVTLNGWLLSLTEARLCALAALAPGGPAEIPM
jgi:hypothetical protein